MIGIALKSGFPAREFLEMAFGRLGTALLQALTQGMMPLAVLLNKLTAKGFACTICRQVDYSEVNSQGIRYLIGCRFRDIKGHCQIEGSFAVDQVGLSLDTLESRRLIAADAKGNKDTPMNGQEGNSSEPLEGHHPLIKDDSAFWTKRGFAAFLSLVDLSHFADGTNSQLCSKLVGSTQCAIHHLLQLKFVGYLRFKCLFSNIVAGSIEGMHGIKQGTMLFFSWGKLQKHRLFHVLSIPRIGINHQ